MTSNASEGPPLLTPRQLEVLELLAKGLPNREIAQALGIAAATVKRHVSSVIAALDVTNRTEAATRLHELGLHSSANENQEEFRVPGFGARPAIAVLPFNNVSSDSELTFLADGFTEDLITRLAQWRWFPIIARNSTFVYKGRAVDMKEVSRTLGARYLVEGSFRPMDERLRITVQVIDGETGEHVWAHAYDRELAEIVSVQDEIVDSIVATLEPSLLQIEGLRVLSTGSDRIDGWEAAQAGWAHAVRNELQGYLEGAALAKQAIELDPSFGLASGLAIYCEFHLAMLGRSSGDSPPADRLMDLGRRALEADAAEPFGFVGTGWARLLHGDREGAMHDLDRAADLGPVMTYPNASRAIVLMANGRTEEAAATCEQTIRLSPLDPILPILRLTHGVALFQLGQIEEAITQIQSTVAFAPKLPHGYAMLAALRSLEGDLDGARENLSRMNEVDADYHPLVPTTVFAPPEAAAIVRDLLVRAGWEESATP